MLLLQGICPSKYCRLAAEIPSFESIVIDSSGILSFGRTGSMEHAYHRQHISSKSPTRLQRFTPNPTQVKLSHLPAVSPRQCSLVQPPSPYQMERRHTFQHSHRCSALLCSVQYPQLPAAPLQHTTRVQRDHSFHHCVRGANALSNGVLSPMGN